MSRFNLLITLIFAFVLVSEVSGQTPPACSTFTSQGCTTCVFASWELGNLGCRWCINQATGVANCVQPNDFSVCGPSHPENPVTLAGAVGCNCLTDTFENSCSQCVADVRDSCEWCTLGDGSCQPSGSDCDTDGDQSATCPSASATPSKTRTRTRTRSKTPSRSPSN